MTIEIEDKTGHLVSVEDIDAAIMAVDRGIVSIGKLMLVPELAVNMPNIRRCLQELKGIREAMARHIPEREP